MLYRKIALFGKEMKPYKEEAKKSPERPPTLNQMIKNDATTLTQLGIPDTASSVTPVELDKTCLQCTDEEKVITQS